MTHRASVAARSPRSTRLSSCAPLADRGTVRADEDEGAPAEPAGLGQLALARAAGVVGVGGEPGAAQLGLDAQQVGTRSALVEEQERVDARRAGRLVGLRGEQEPLDARAEADARRRRPADRLDQAVVAAAAADRVLRADRRVLELEGRPRVVVEAAYEGRRELVGDAHRVQVLANGREVLTAGVAQRLADRRRAAEKLLHALVLHVEDAQRRGRALRARLGVELGLVLVEPGGEPLDVRRPAVGVADRVEVEHAVPDAEPVGQRRVELDDLGVDRRVVGADRLDRELPVLAVPALLRAVVPPHRADRVELLRLRLAVQAVLEVGARDRRGRLRSQRERAAASVLERVRLLLDDVRALAGRADDQVGVLERGRVDPPVAVEGADRLHRRPRPLPERLLGREDVVRSAGRFERHRAARSSARNGLRSSSAPSVVGGPWPE